MKQDEKEEEDEFTIIQRQEKEWKSTAYQIMAALTSDPFKIFVILCIFANYFVTTLCYVFLHENVPETLYDLMIFLDSMYAFDYIVVVVLLFWKDAQRHLNRKPRSKIILVIDFFLAFPYSYIYESVTHKTHDDSALLALKFLTVVPIIHCPIYFKKRADRAGTNHLRDFVIQCVACIFLIQQTGACIFFLMTWECTLTEVKQRWTNMVEIRQQFTDELDQYWFCLCYTMMNLTQRNFGYVAPLDFMEIIYFICITLVGFILTTGIFTGVLSFLFEAMNARMSVIRYQIQDIKEYLQRIHITDKEADHMKNYYRILWERKDGIHEPPTYPQLPFSVKSEVSVDINFGPLTTSIIFRDQSDAFFRAVASIMKHEFYQAEELIYCANVVKDKMIFVLNGIIDVLSNDDDESRIISLGKGTCLGECALILTLPSKCSVKAVCYTELQVLYRKDFYSLLGRFPQIFQAIRQSVMERIKTAREKISPEQVPEKDKPFVVNLRSPILQVNVDTMIKTVKDKLQGPLSEEDKYLTIYKLNTEAPDPDERQIFLSNTFPWILQPNTALQRSWEYFIIILCIIIAFTYPYYIVYYFDFYSDFHDTIVMYIDLFLMLDFLIILCTAIRERDTTTKSFIQILRKLLTRPGFYCDFLSCIKIELFCIPFTGNQRSCKRLIFNRLLKCYRVPKHINNIDENLNKHVVVLRLIKYLFYIMTFTYWFGAILYINTCDDTCVENGWFLTKRIRDVQEGLTPYSFADNPVLASVYYSLFYLNRPTSPALRPTNIPDLLLGGYFGSLVGLFLTGYCVAGLAATLTHQQKRKINYKEKFLDLRRFFKEKNMPKNIIQRVEDYYALQWYCDKGAAMLGTLFHNASPNVRKKIELAERWNVISNLSLFKGFNNDFLEDLVMEMRTLIIPAEKFVSRRGEICDIIYIVVDGYCFRDIRSSLRSRILGPGSFFGKTALFSKTRHVTSIRTLTTVKLFWITYDAFRKCASQYPIIWKHIEETKQILNLDETDIKRIGDRAADLTVEVLVDAIRGSFINVLSYCRKNNESYAEPFNRLSYLYWLKFVMLPICILPRGNFLKVWMTIRLVAATVVALVTPYVSVQYPNISNFYYVVIAMDVIAYMDLILMFYVGYYGPKNQLIFHPMKTATNYIKGKFLIDLFLCLPWEIIAENVKTLYDGYQQAKHTSYYIISLFMLVRVFQFHRVSLFFTYISGNVKRNGDLYQIIKFVPIIIIGTNMWAAIFVNSTCAYYCEHDFRPEDFYNESHVKPAKMMIRPLTHHSVICMEKSWFDTSPYRDMIDPTEVYTLSFFYCAGILTNCGLGDMTPKLTHGVILTLMMIICGSLYFGFIYAKIASHKADWRVMQTEHHVWVVELKKFMVKERVKKDLQKQIINRLEYRWKRSRGAVLNEILSHLSPILQDDAFMSMYEDVMREVPIFQNVDKVLYKIIGRLLKETYYFRDECIFETDDLTSQIFIITNGTVRISQNQRPDIYMEKGGIFGNISLQPKLKLSITITCMTNVDVLIMENRGFFHSLRNFPEEREKIISAISNFEFMRPAWQTERLDRRVLAQMQKIRSQRHEIKHNLVKALQIILGYKFGRTALSPYSKIYKILNMICMFLAYVNCFFVLYEFCFRHRSPYLLIKSAVIDLVFFLRLVLRLHRAYEDEFGVLVESNAKIIKHYFQNKKIRRICDFLGSVPFFYLTFLLYMVPGVDPYLYFSGTRLLTLYRLLIYFDYFEEKSRLLMTKTARFKAITMFIWVSISIHCLACAWYLCSCPLFYCIENSWTTVYAKDHEPQILYLKCLYFIIVLVTKAGSGDILPVSIFERIVVALIMLLTNFWIGVFIGDVINILNTASLATVKYERRIKKIEIYYKNCSISEYQMNKLQNYMEELWQQSSGNQIPRLVSQLHYHSIHLLMLDIYGHHLRNAYIFRDVESSFIRQLTPFLTRNIYFPGNYIVKHGDSDASMYFIHRGSVEIFTIHPNMTETKHDTLEAGESFGVYQGLHHGVPHHFSFRAKTTVNTVSLRLNDWEHLLTFFPASRDSIFEKVNAISFNF